MKATEETGKLMMQIIEHINGQSDEEAITSLTVLASWIDEVKDQRLAFYTDSISWGDYAPTH